MTSDILTMRGRASVRRIAALVLFAALDAPASISQTMTLPGPDAYTSKRFNSSDELKVEGKILRVDLVEKDTIIWMRAEKVVRTGFGQRPGQNEAPGAGKIWRVEGSGANKVQGSPGLAADAAITVSGENHIDTACEPTCRIKAKRVQLQD
jgi:hypothetical protein